MSDNIHTDDARLVLYQNLFNTSPDPIFIEDENGIVVDANEAACRFQGLPRAKLVGSNVLDLVPGNQRDRVERDFKRWITGEMVRYEGFAQIANGTVIPVSVHGLRIEYDGRPAIILHVRDNTKLYRSRQDYAMIFEHMIAGCALHEIILDDTGRPVNAIFLTVNKAYELLVGKTADELVGKTILEVFPEADSAWILKLGRVATTGEKMVFENYSRPLGKHFEVSAYSPEPGRVVTILYETTERHHAIESLKNQQERERQLLAAQKLESLGILAGGIAHDFNNLLAGVLGNADLALMQLGEYHPARECIEQVRVSGRRASELTQLMLAYSGRAQFNHGQVTLNSLIRDTCQLVETGISKKITISTTLDQNLPPVNGDIAQLRQLIMNLLTNAADAIGDQTGHIGVTTDTRTLTPENFRRVDEIEPLKSGDYAVMEIRDTGCGIAPEVMPRVFEPFFTSKFPGRGLGLAAALGIVRGHRGCIEIETKPGVGTAFRIALPVTRKAGSAPASANKPANEEASRAEGGGTVLVTDDQPEVRRVVGLLLKRMGHDVIEAEDGREAIRLLNERGAEIKLVILDMTMPNMNGKETLSEIQKTNDRVPVLLMSGFSESETEGKISSRQVRGYLEKPFDMALLRRKINEAMQPGA